MFTVRVNLVNLMNVKQCRLVAANSQSSTLILCMQTAIIYNHHHYLLLLCPKAVNSFYDPTEGQMLRQLVISATYMHGTVFTNILTVSHIS